MMESRWKFIGESDMRPLDTVPPEYKAHIALLDAAVPPLPARFGESDRAERIQVHLHDVGYLSVWSIPARFYHLKRTKNET